MPKKDFVLLGLADEFAAYQAEADMVRAFLESRQQDEVRREACAAMRAPELGWPVALNVLLGVEGPQDQERRMVRARREVLLDLERNAGAYWNAHHNDWLEPHLRESIQTWYRSSPEWKEIAAGRSAWSDAERQLRRSEPKAR
jgi:hypothetical protein